MEEGEEEEEEGEGGTDRAEAEAEAEGRAGRDVVRPGRRRQGREEGRRRILLLLRRRQSSLVVVVVVVVVVVGLRNAKNDIEAMKLRRGGGADGVVFVASFETTGAAGGGRSGGGGSRRHRCGVGVVVGVIGVAVGTIDGHDDRLGSLVQYEYRGRIRKDGRIPVHEEYRSLLGLGVRFAVPFRDAGHHQSCPSFLPSFVAAPIGSRTLLVYPSLH
mmetsp:Transcript_41179/g.124457  ORF Transcript_41179/g.124457 Transcript_41179/m.124457 type:complete len:216 (+) Transcript_41179:1-648(+)